MPKLTITVGVSASGKTTWVKSLDEVEFFNTVNINKDDIRFNIIKPGANWKTYNPRGNETKVTQLQVALVESAVSSRENIIISDTNLNPKVRSFWKDFARKNYYDFEIKEFSISLEEAIKRDANRENSVGEEAIKKQYQLWLHYLETKESKEM
jgi:predicted kinase|nr:MAG TPA: polynucleotide kinase [Bacteriophage sp.]